MLALRYCGQVLARRSTSVGRYINHHRRRTTSLSFSLAHSRTLFSPQRHHHTRALKTSKYLSYSTTTTTTTTTTTAAAMSAHVAIPAYGSVHANIISDHFTKPEWAKSVAEYYSTARPDDRILAVFCDGGTSTRHGGYTSYAVCWRDPDTQEWHETGGLLANNPSSNAAEVFAVARALETAADILDEYEGRFTTVKVFTDYQGVLTKLKELRTLPQRHVRLAEGVLRGRAPPRGPPRRHGPAGRGGHALGARPPRRRGQRARRQGGWPAPGRARPPAAGRGEEEEGAGVLGRDGEGGAGGEAAGLRALRLVVCLSSIPPAKNY